jgi:hypothetical protein
MKGGGLADTKSEATVTTPFRRLSATVLRLPNQHLCKDTVDEYVLGRLHSAETDAAETHLLTCETCLQMVEEAETLVSILRSAQKMSSVGQKREASS